MCAREQELLEKDVEVMKRIIANPKEANREDLTIDFRIRTFDDVSWKTAQSTGALSYMPYSRAQEYSYIYSAQNEITEVEHQAARDTVLAIAPFVGSKKGEANPGGEEAVKIMDRLQILQGQLYLSGVADSWAGWRVQEVSCGASEVTRDADCIDDCGVRSIVGRGRDSRPDGVCGAWTVWDFVHYGPDGAVDGGGAVDYGGFGGGGESYA